jgi:hypothetical protein
MRTITFNKESIVRDILFDSSNRTIVITPKSTKSVERPRVFSTIARSCSTDNFEMETLFNTHDRIGEEEPELYLGLVE